MTEEARATYCFCGCGDRVTHPRLVVTNANGWELSAELAEWTKLEILWLHTGDPLPQPLQKNIDDGQDLWVSLANAIHSGERADKQHEATAVYWRKHAKKGRRKLARRLRRGGMPDPFDLPDLGAEDLNAWITEGREPAWATELGGYGPEPDIDVDRVLSDLDVGYERDLAALDSGPRIPEGPDGDVVARLYVGLEKRLASVEEGLEPLPDPAPDARRRYIALEERSFHESQRDDPEDFRAANDLAIGIGLLLRELEGTEAAPISEEFTRALGSDDGDPVSVTPRLMELASISRDYQGPPDEHGHPSRSGTDPLLLSLFAPGEQVWEAIAWWAEEYVRLKTMRVVGFAVVMNRTEGIRFGYLLACYLEHSGSGPAS